MAKRKTKPKKRERRTFTDEYKQEAVQMLLDGHSASSVSKNLGIGTRIFCIAGKPNWWPQVVPWPKRLTTKFAVA